jgi:hypothetical protein
MSPKKVKSGSQIFITDFKIKRGSGRLRKYSEDCGPEARNWEKSGRHKRVNSLAKLSNCYDVGNKGSKISNISKGSKGIFGMDTVDSVVLTNQSKLSPLKKSGRGSRFNLTRVRISSIHRFADSEIDNNTQNNENNKNGSKSSKYSKNSKTPIQISKQKISQFSLKKKEANNKPNTKSKGQKKVKGENGKMGRVTSMTSVRQSRHSEGKAARRAATLKGANRRVEHVGKGFILKRKFGVEGENSFRSRSEMAGKAHHRKVALLRNSSIFAKNKKEIVKKKRKVGCLISVFEQRSGKRSRVMNGFE